MDPRTELAHPAGELQKFAVRAGSERPALQLLCTLLPPGLGTPVLAHMPLPTVLPPLARLLLFARRKYPEEDLVSGWGWGGHRSPSICLVFGVQRRKGMKAEGGQGETQTEPPGGRGVGLVLLYFTLENSINNSKSKRLQVSGTRLWDTGQPIRYNLLPPPPRA